MPSEQEAQWLAVAVEAAKEAGALIREAFLKPKNVQFKGQMDLVTETDKECERVIISRLRAAFPDHAFIGEETSAEQGFTSALEDGPTWCIDPLDGTTNFVHRSPFVCTCIGLVVGKQPVVGVVYNPVLNEMFTAVQGGGATLNGQPIQVSETAETASALLATEVGVSRDNDTMDAITGRVRQLTQQSRSLRCGGSCALNMCGVACGRLDAFYEIGFGGPWDTAAATIVVREAGGQVLDCAGGEFDLMARRVLAANARLGPQYAKLLAAAPLAAAEPQPPAANGGSV